MTRIAPFLCAVALACEPAFAAPDLSFLPPIETVNKIIAEHPIVARANAGMDEAKAGAERLRIGPHEPLVSGYLGNRTVNNIGDFMVWDFSLSRGIRLGDKADLDKQTGEIGLRYGENAIEDAKHETAILLMIAWVDWLEADARALIDEAEAQSYARERDAVSQRVARQDAAQRDSDLANAAYARAAAAALVSRGTAADARATLQRVFPELTVPSGAPVIAAPELPALPLEQWFELILRRSHEVRMAELEAARQQNLAARAERDRRPDPSIGMRAYSDQSGAETAFALTFSLPLGLAGRSAAADAQQARANAALADLARIRREFEQRAHLDVLRAEFGISAWQEAKTAENAGATALQRTARGYELGEFDLSDLLLFVRQSFDARRTELGARAAAQRALLQLQIDGHELWVIEEENELTD